MIISILIAYMLGSIPFGKIITKLLTGEDITKTGSKNIGATNVYRTVSKGWLIGIIIRRHQTNNSPSYNLLFLYSILSKL
jgi:glycerol-3-phosphate acyltransferase PlsY